MSNKQASQQPSWKRSLISFANSHAHVITITLVALVLFGGVTLKDSPERWWMVALIILGLGVFTVILISGRVILKAGLSIFVMLYLALNAFDMGTMATGSITVGSMWLLQLMVTYLLLLTMSYVRPSVAGRWGMVTIVTLLGFALSYSLMDLVNFVPAALALSSLLQLALFFVIYDFLPRRLAVPRGRFPEARVTEELRQWAEKLAAQGWGYRELKRKRAQGLLLWSSERAYVVSVVNFEAKMALAGKLKREHLNYRQRSVNGWLHYLVNELVPLRGMRGADVTLVLLDEHNGNGGEVRVVGVGVPNSKAKIPVGIVPAEGLTTKKGAKRVQTALEQDLLNYGKHLKEKQLEALDMKLPPRDEEGNLLPEEPSTKPWWRRMRVRAVDPSEVDENAPAIDEAAEDQTSIG